MAVFDISRYGALPGKDATTAIQKARVDLTAAGGGTLYVPFSVTTRLGWQQGPLERLRADDPSTSITWTADLGASTPPVVSCQDGTRPSAIHDITLIGPGNQACPLGVAPCKMPGPVLFSKGELDHVNIEGFYSGPMISGDHQVITSCRVRNCYYSAMFAPGGSYGNQSFTNCTFETPKMAGFGVHGDAVIDCATLMNVHLYGGPYGIFKENTGGYTKEILTNSHCLIWFEAQGNGAIFDQGNSKSVDHNHFFELGYIWQPSYRLPSAPADYVIFCRAFEMNMVEFNVLGVPPGAKGVVNAAASSGNQSFPS